MTRQSGSKAATRLASPTPSQSPTSANASCASRSPAAAASVTIGPVSSCGLPPHISSSMVGRVAKCSRAKRTRALPLQYCSQQPRPPHWQDRPPGTTCMWPNSPAMPFIPRCRRPPRTTPPPMPGAERHQDRVLGAARRAVRRLGVRRRGGVVLEDHRHAPALLERLPDRSVQPGQVRGEHHPLAVGVHEAGCRHPDARDLVVPGDRVDGLGERVLDHAYVDPTARRRPPRRTDDLPLLVHDAGQHLGAADVDADPDSFAHGPSLAHPAPESGHGQFGLPRTEPSG